MKALRCLIDVPSRHLLIGRQRQRDGNKAVNADINEVNAGTNEAKG
jgi:hypothetical protein